MRKISLEELKVMCKVIKKTFPKKSRDFYKMMLSTESLRLMVDNEWLNQSVFEIHKKKPKTTREARTFFRSAEGGFQWQERVRRLAERIFNLQHIENIEDVILKIKERGLTSRFAELEAAVTFFRRNIPFKFINPTGEKGADFDIVIESVPKINCEVKHKIENTVMSEKTILSSLKRARNQMPKEEPSLIVMKIPEDWVKNPEITDIMPSALETFFKKENSKMVIGIIFRWEERHPSNNGIFFWKYRLEKNKSHIIKDLSIKDILNKIESKPTRWIDFEMILDEC